MDDVLFHAVSVAGLKLFLYCEANAALMAAALFVDEFDDEFDD